MLRHLCSVTGLLLAVCLSVVPVRAQQDRAHQLAAQAASQVAVQCGNVPTLADCHPSQPTGCSHAQHPRYDAYLNFLKNQQPARDLPPDRVLDLRDFIHLEEKLPPRLKQTNHVDFAGDLANIDGIGEGNIYTVVGYLYFVEDTAVTSNHHGETTNCQLRGNSTFDFHLGIGFDPALAAQIRQNPPPHDSRNPGPLEQTSIVAEMTPHTRDPQWTVTRLTRQRGKQVKVIGQLLLDNPHANTREDCAFLGDPPRTCWRASIWEIHPVTQFFVCKTGRTCTATSPDSDWTRLENMP
jgi:hypothetical protein